MRIVILTMGTRGDVQPYVALGAGFQRAGHHVRVAAPEPYEAFVTAYGLDFAPLAGDPVQLVRGLVDEAGFNPLRSVQVMTKYVLSIAVEVMQNAWKACQDADAILSSFLMINAGHEVARLRSVPDFSAQLFPVFTPTQAFPSPAFPSLPWGSVYNRLTHAVFAQVFWQGGRLAYRMIRRRLPDMPAHLHWPFAASDRGPTPTLYGFSPLVIPPPSDWGSAIHVTGYWFLDAGSEWQPPAALVDFLESGPPPVYVGFGSMVTRDADRLTRIVVEALAQSDQRAVLLGGWSDLGGDHLPDRVFKIEAAPHDWLFPRMAAVVHHGGAGTTGAALRAGVPQVVVPFTADQPFWGERVRALHVGPPPINRKRLTADRLADCIRFAVADPAVRSGALALGERIHAEDGVGNAVRVVEQAAAAFPA